VRSEPLTELQRLRSSGCFKYRCVQCARVYWINRKHPRMECTPENDRVMKFATRKPTPERGE
jgi:uncharacterized protein with PIN domain